MDLNVYILDSQPLFRKVLVCCLKRYCYGNLKVQLDTDEPSAILSAVTAMRDDAEMLVLLDIYHLGENPYVFIPKLRQAIPDRLYIMVCADCQNLHAIISLIHSGADGFVAKQVTEQELFDGIHAIVTSGSFLPPEVSRTLVGLLKNGKMNNGILSEKEIEFLSYVRSDLGYKQIAGKIHVSPGTVDKICRDIEAKTGISTRHGLAIIAYEMGL